MSDVVEPLDGTLFGDDQPCFGCGPKHPNGMHLRFERDGDEVVSRFTPTVLHQGPPGIMHGGLVATFADEVAAWALVVGLGKFGFTVSFDARYRKAVRVGEEIVGRARVVGPAKRLVSVDARVLQGGEVAFTGAFKFALLDRASTERVIGGPLPDAWARWSR